MDECKEKTHLISEQLEKVNSFLEDLVCSEKSTVVCFVLFVKVYLGFWVFLGRSTAWMLGRTPPWAMVTPESSLFNSSSLRMAN